MMRIPLGRFKQSHITAQSPCKHSSPAILQQFTKTVPLKKQTINNSTQNVSTPHLRGRGRFKSPRHKSPRQAARRYCCDPSGHCQAVSTKPSNWLQLAMSWGALHETSHAQRLWRRWPWRGGPLVVDVWLLRVAVALHVAIIIITPVTKLPPPVEYAALCMQTHRESVLMGLLAMPGWPHHRLKTDE